MKVIVDQMKCSTIGVCVKELPQVFRFQAGSKKAEVILDEIPPALQQQCRQVSKKCPSGAIQIQE
jgi:ferredoxin